MTCLLDSDAFPVRADWEMTLSAAMGRFSRKFSAPVRAENYDAFPHISFIYATTNNFLSLKKSLLDTRGAGPNLHSGRRRDVAASLPRNQCLCLLKSNTYSPHLMFHCIYGDLIYHAAAASRKQVTSNWKIIASHKLWDAVAPRLAAMPPPFHEPTPEFINRLLGEERFCGAFP